MELIVGMLLKSFVSCGGFLVGLKKLIELLYYFCFGFLLYSIGISFVNVVVALVVVCIVMAELEWVMRL